MKNYFTLNEWSIVEEGFRPEYNQATERVCSLGNGRMGQRANFEEKYSGETRQENYVAGINHSINNWQGDYKIGYSKKNYINAPSWIGIEVQIDGIELDLATCQVQEFRRELNMREGYLYRRARVRLSDGKELEINSLRFTSLADDELGAIRYTVTPLNFNGIITYTPYLRIEEYSQTEKAWQEISSSSLPGEAYITAQSKITQFQVSTGMRLMLEKDGSGVETTVELIQQENFVGNKITALVEAGQEFVLYKYAAVVSSGNYPAEKLPIACELALDRATSIGFAQLLEAHGEVWAEKWQASDIIIKGDLPAQQAIRYNIFQLHQSFTGEDDRANIFASAVINSTNGSSTSWFAMNFCLPFYLATAPPPVARNLLLCQYHQLPLAMDFAEKSGFAPGAALFLLPPHHLTESQTQEETIFTGIYRNGAIGLAISDYLRYTGDTRFLIDYGLEILLGISRGWAQWLKPVEEVKLFEGFDITEFKENGKKVMNNPYIQLLGNWCLNFTLAILQQVKEQYPEEYKALQEKINFAEATETVHWQDLIQKTGFILQKENPDLPAADEYFNKLISYEAELVIPGILLLEDQTDFTLRGWSLNLAERNLIQENSPWSSQYAVLAARMGHTEQAFRFYQQNARSFLDDFDKEIQPEWLLPIVAGNWQAIVKGFGGMRVQQNQLHLQPILPSSWEKYSFKFRFREHLLSVSVSQLEIKIVNDSAIALKLQVYGTEETIGPNGLLSVKR